MSGDKPIIFCGEMVRAILEGRKTQTRRVIDRDLWDCLEDGLSSDKQYIETDGTPMGGVPAVRFCPYGPVGTRLWVRETWAPDPCKRGQALYRADETGLHKWRWRPSIHMPRWASRLTLEVTDIRVQRVQDISETDAAQEGVWVMDSGVDRYYCMAERTGGVYRSPSKAFRELWDSINEKRGYGWQVNPWVWAVTFRVAQGGAEMSGEHMDGRHADVLLEVANAGNQGQTPQGVTHE